MQRNEKLIHLLGWNLRTEHQSKVNTDLGSNLKILNLNKYRGYQSLDFLNYF